jgi:hypothetical protein
MPKSGYRSLTIREETARRLEALANTKRIGIVELVERYADAVELITLQEAAVSIAFEDKLTKIWYRLYYVEKSLPGFHKLRDSLLRNGQDVPLFDELVHVIDVRAKIERLLDESYPKWYQNVSHSEPFILVTKNEEFKTVVKEFVQRLDECFNLVQEVKNILPDSPLVRALEDIMSPLKETRKALNVLV